MNSNNIYTDAYFTDDKKSVIRCFKNGVIVNIPAEESNADYNHIKDIGIIILDAPLKK